MSTLIAQHPFLWLIAAFLLGLLVKWLLDLFFLREDRERMESLARKTKEELESERFGHNRLQNDFKARGTELDQAQKGRALAESLLTATKTRLAETETALATARQTAIELESTLTDTQRQLEETRGETVELRAQNGALGLRLVAAEAQAETHAGAATELRQELARVEGEASDAQAQVTRLERDLQAQLTKASALEADLNVALQGQSAAQASLNETQGALRQVQEHLADLSRRATQAAGEAALQGETLVARDQELQAARAEQERLEQVIAAQTGGLTSLQLEARQAAEQVSETHGLLASVEADKAALAARCEKLETAAQDSRADAQAAEHKLKARIDEVKELANQLGEASEELAELRKKVSQLQANFEAATATRQTLEQEVARLEATAAKPAPEPNSDQAGELISLREEVQEWEREVSTWKGKAEELEAELLATSRAHRELEAEAERLRSSSASGGADDALLAELEVMTRERNELAAELAGLKAQSNDHEDN